jgi:hypothetical protein
MIVDSVGHLDPPPRLEVRLGIATGLAVVGDLIGEGSAREQTVVGETPNLAARLQALAGPNGIVIAEATRHCYSAIARSWRGTFPPQRDRAQKRAAMLVSPRNPSRTTRIFSSAEYRRHVALRMSLTVFSALSGLVARIGIIVSFRRDDEPKTQSSQFVRYVLTRDSDYIPGIGMISTISIHVPGTWRWGWSLPNIFVAASCDSACTTE